MSRCCATCGETSRMPPIFCATIENCVSCAGIRCWIAIDSAPSGREYANWTSVLPGAKGPVTTEEEAKLVMNNIKQVVEQAGLTMDDIVFLHVYCTDLSNYNAFNVSLWTIQYEFICYLLVGLFGLLGILKRIPTLLLFIASMALYALQQQRHPRTGADTLARQQMRQPIRRLIKLAISPRDLTAADRHRLGCAGRLRGEQLRNRHRRWCGLGQHRPVTYLIEAGVLTGIEHIDR